MLYLPIVAYGGADVPAMSQWPPTISCGGYILGIVQGQPPMCYILMPHQTVFILY